nr:uncharacterized protein LOC109175482 [Ipomoea batatas]GMC64627.1 uncharacterized protein LOC109175482 [Ipomoea batatas]GMC68165.1 uncharacterized protein LOC109175482 [Ipomoea batatas]
MAANVNSAGQSRSEKYGVWMLVTRKERRNRPNRANQPGYGPTFDRRQEMPTHSRFASLESLEETNLAQDQINLERGLDLQQPEDALPRIITNGKKNQRSPVQSNSGTHRKPSGAVSGRQVQFDFQNKYQTDQYGGNQMAYREGLPVDQQGRTAPKIISIEAKKFSAANQEDFESDEPGRIRKCPRNSSLLKNKIIAAQIETAATRNLELLCWNYEAVAALEILHCCRPEVCC